MKTALLLLVMTLALSGVEGYAGPFDMGHNHGGDDDDAPVGVKISGLADFRAVHTSARRSWLYNSTFYNAGAGTTFATVSKNGEGKLRYGGKDINADQVGDRKNTELAVPQVSIMLDADVLPATKFHLQANLDADNETGNGNSLALIEVFTRSEFASGDDAFQVKLGAFIPPMSWEHGEPGWSTKYTLTPSAIGTWAGEDLRAFGGEGTWQRHWNDKLTTKLIAGVFSGSDQTGWVLLERGWALHDYQAPLDFTYQLQASKDGAVVSGHPFKEVDGKLGGYGRADFDFFQHLLHVTGGYWDNRGDKKVQSFGSHLDVYHTKFADASAKFSWRRLTVIGHTLSGKVESLAWTPGKDIKSSYVLVSYVLGDYRLSARGDTFEVETREKGTAGTVALTRKAGKQEVTAEYTTARTDPFGPTKARVDALTSLNYRIRF